MIDNQYSFLSIRAHARKQKKFLGLVRMGCEAVGGIIKKRPPVEALLACGGGTSSCIQSKPIAALYFLFRLASSSGFISLPLTITFLTHSSSSLSVIKQTLGLVNFFVNSTSIIRPAHLFIGLRFSFRLLLILLLLYRYALSRCQIHALVLLSCLWG